MITEGSCNTENKLNQKTIFFNCNKFNLNNIIVFIVNDAALVIYIYIYQLQTFSYSRTKSIFVANIYSFRNVKKKI